MISRPLVLPSAWPPWLSEASLGINSSTCFSALRLRPACHRFTRGPERPEGPKATGPGSHGSRSSRGSAYLVLHFLPLPTSLHSAPAVRFVVENKIGQTA